jgi:hypothetical protein
MIDERINWDLRRQIHDPCIMVCMKMCDQQEVNPLNACTPRRGYNPPGSRPRLVEVSLNPFAANPVSTSSD